MAKGDIVLDTFGNVLIDDTTGQAKINQEDFVQCPGCCQLDCVDENGLGCAVCGTSPEDSPGFISLAILDLNPATKVSESNSCSCVNIISTVGTAASARLPHPNFSVGANLTASSSCQWSGAFTAHVLVFDGVGCTGNGQEVQVNARATVTKVGGGWQVAPVISDPVQVFGTWISFNFGSSFVPDVPNSPGNPCQQQSDLGANSTTCSGVGLGDQANPVLIGVIQSGSMFVSTCFQNCGDCYFCRFSIAANRTDVCMVPVACQAYKDEDDATACCLPKVIRAVVIGASSCGVGSCIRCQVIDAQPPCGFHFSDWQWDSGGPVDVNGVHDLRPVSIDRPSGLLPDNDFARGVGTPFSPGGSGADNFVNTDLRSVSPNDWDSYSDCFMFTKTIPFSGSYTAHEVPQDLLTCEPTVGLCEGDWVSAVTLIKAVAVLTTFGNVPPASVGDYISFTIYGIGSYVTPGSNVETPCYVTLVSGTNFGFQPDANCMQPFVLIEDSSCCGVGVSAGPSLRSGAAVTTILPCPADAL